MIDDASISHHLVRDLLQFSHMIAAIRVPSAQFIIKIVSIRVQYQGYFDPDNRPLLSQLHHLQNIDTTITADPISLQVHFVWRQYTSTYQY